VPQTQAIETLRALFGLTGAAYLTRPEMHHARILLQCTELLASEGHPLDDVVDRFTCVLWLVRLMAGPAAAADTVMKLQQEWTSATQSGAVSDTWLLARECVTITVLRVLSFQSVKEPPVPPQLITAALTSSLALFPHNPQIFSAFIVSQYRSRVAGRTRRHCDTLIASHRISIASSLLAVMSEVLQPVIPIYRLRSLLERLCDACVSCSVNDAWVTLLPLQLPDLCRVVASCGKCLSLDGLPCSLRCSHPLAAWAGSSAVAHASGL
jgi:hypothetical protein